MAAQNNIRAMNKMTPNLNPNSQNNMNNMNMMNNQIIGMNNNMNFGFI